MPRSARIEFEGAIHHVTMRGNRGVPIFLEDRDRKFFTRELALVSDTYGWTWLSYCQMTNHVHLVIETPKPTLGLGMRQLAGRYAQTFNKRHDTYGHLFQERYGSVVVTKDVHLAQLLRYVALNPVKAELCAEPEQWRWSSHRALLHGRSHPARARLESLLEVWGGREGTRYPRLFEAAAAERFGDECPWDARPPLTELLAAPDRDDGMRAARDHGYRLKEIAAALGVSEGTVSRRTRRPRRASKGSVPDVALDTPVRAG